MILQTMYIYIWYRIHMYIYIYYVFYMIYIYILYTFFFLTCFVSMIQYLDELIFSSPLHPSLHAEAVTRPSVCHSLSLQNISELVFYRIYYINVAKRKSNPIHDTITYKYWSLLQHVYASLVSPTGRFPCCFFPYSNKLANWMGQFVPVVGLRDELELLRHDLWSHWHWRGRLKGSGSVRSKHTGFESFLFCNPYFWGLPG